MVLLRSRLIHIFYILLFILCSCSVTIVEGRRHVKERGIMENINNGIKYAGQILGINTAADVANLVAKTFSHQASTVNPDQSSMFRVPEKLSNHDRDNSSSLKINPTDMIGGLLRMIGFDAGKLGALAINALLMIAQLIGNTLTRRHLTKSSDDAANSHSIENEDTTYEDQQDERLGRQNTNYSTFPDWILSNPPESLSKFIEHITDGKLAEKLTEAITSSEDGEERECTKLLMCKSSPFIWSMQKSVTNRLNLQNQENTEKLTNERPVSFLFQNFPDIEEYRRHGYFCEQRYSHLCNRNHL